MKGSALSVSRAFLSYSEMKVLKAEIAVRTICFDSKSLYILLTRVHLYHFYNFQNKQ
jgi:hypothetical protein